MWLSMPNLVSKYSGCVLAFILLQYGSALADEIGVRHANHIFNAVHSSMRQWGSSLNHNGMSFFLAHVPPGIQFHHGSPSPTAVRGMEWLAFEPEHAIQFAFKRPPRPDPPFESTNGMDRHSSSIHDMHEHDSRPPPPFLQTDDHQSHIMVQRSAPGGRPRRPIHLEPGWLHTYRTRDMIQLLYIDGTSAGKSSMGTLDSQDLLLLNRTLKDDNDPFWEVQRAQRLCKLAEDTWHGKIQGFIRMEAGFEIIMCSFETNLEFLGSVRAGPITPRYDNLSPNGLFLSNRSASGWIKAVAARYDGIGGGRVHVNYQDLVTAFDYDIDLFQSDTHLPRLANVSDAALQVIRDDLNAMINNNWEPNLRARKRPFLNWQSIADMVVERYQEALKYLASEESLDPGLFYEGLNGLLQTFIDTDDRNFTAEVSRCAQQFIPTSFDPKNSTASRAVRSINERICSTLFTAFNVDVPIEISKTNLRTLVDYLDWTVWKRCDKCRFDEVCFIPMWPFGAVEDHDHPQCRNHTELESRSGYWNNGRHRFQHQS